MASDIAATAGVARGVGQAFPAMVEIRTNLWHNWALIAIEHELEAVAAGQMLVRDWSKPGIEVDILREMHPAMVAIVASALAIDALHGDVAPLLGRDSYARPKGKQWGYMLDTFRLGYTDANRWSQDFAWLFGLRGQVVHFRSSSKGTVPHPTLPTSVAPENATMSAGSATRAVEILLRVFRAIANPAPTTPAAAAEWGAERAPALERFERLRAGSTNR